MTIYATLDSHPNSVIYAFETDAAPDGYTPVSESAYNAFLQQHETFTQQAKDAVANANQQFADEQLALLSAVNGITYSSNVGSAPVSATLPALPNGWYWTNTWYHLSDGVALEGLAPSDSASEVPMWVGVITPSGKLSLYPAPAYV